MGRVSGVFIGDASSATQAAGEGADPGARSGGTAVAGASPISRKVAILTVLAFTWLNPHVYLDTLVFLGSVATSHGDRKWWFGAGAALASVLWFTALGYGARFLGPLFARPAAWRILDAVIAVVMITLGATLAFGG